MPERDELGNEPVGDDSLESGVARTRRTTLTFPMPQLDNGSGDAPAPTQRSPSISGASRDDERARDDQPAIAPPSRTGVHPKKRRTHPSISFGSMVSQLPGHPPSAAQLNAPIALTTADPAALSAPPSDPPGDSAVDAERVEANLDKAMTIAGVFAAAIVDYDSGALLGTRNRDPSFDVAIAASGNAELVRANIKIIDRLELDDIIDDISITIDSQIHIIRPLSRSRHLFIYLAIDRKLGNLALARHMLASLKLN